MPRPPADDPAGESAANGDPSEADASPPRPTRRRVLAGLSGLGALGSVTGCGGRNTPPGTATDETAPAGDATATDGTADRGPTPAPAGPWPQARADAGNTGAVAAAAPTDDPSLRWTVTAAGTVGALVGRHTDGSGDTDAVYAASEDGRVVSLTRNGGERWRAAAPPSRFPPAVSSGRVVVSGRDSLTVVGADTGAVRRSIDVSEDALLSPTLVGNRALLGTFASGVVAIDLDTGTRLWEAGVPSRAYPPVVTDGVAYATARRWETDSGERAGVVVAIDIDSGEIRWEAPLDGEPTAPPAVHGSVVYAGTNRGRVHAVGAADGGRRWREPVGDWVTRGPTAAADGVYVVVLGEGVAKLAPDGAVEWRSDAGGATDPALTDDLAVVGTHDGVVAVDRADGRTRWRVTTDGSVQFDVRVADGRVYAGDGHGTVRAVDADAGDPVWTHPLRPARMPGPVVGPRTVAGGGRDGGTYDILATDGTEFPLAGGAATGGITPAVLDGRDLSAEGSAGTGTADGDLLFGDGTLTAGGSTDDGSARETILGGGVDGSLFRVRTAEYGEPPSDGLGPTPTPTATPGPGDPTVTRTPHIDLPEAAPAWTATLDARIRSPVTYADGVAYVGTGEGVVAVDPRDGSVRWAVDLGAPVTGAPAVGDGRVVAVTAAGRLVGIEARGDADGSERLDWETRLDAGSGAGPTVSDGTVFVAGDEGVVSAFGAGGEPRWTHEVDAPVTGGTAVTDTRVVVGTEAAAVVALDREDRSVAWRTPTPGPVRGTPAVAGGSDPTVYAADHDGTLSAFDAADGAVRFRREVGRWLDAPPAVGHGAVFVADQTGRVFAVVGA